MRAPLLISALLLAGGCSITNDGADPPVGRFYFPVAAALSPAEADAAPKFLYLANANFDLRYNAGTVETVDLEAAAERITDDCTDCVIEDAGDVIVSSVRIGSQAGPVALAPAGDRLFVGVREDRDLTTINVDPGTGELACGGSSDGHECASKFRSVAIGGGDSPVRPSGEFIDLEVGRITDLGVEAPAQASYLLAVHRSGQITLLSDRVADGDAGLDDERVPTTVASLRTANTQLAGMALDRERGLAWVTNARNRTIARVGLSASGVEEGALLGELYAANAPLLSGLNFGQFADTRDLVFDAYEDGTERAYVLSRSPEAVLVVTTDNADAARLRVERSITVGQGPSRLAEARVSIRGEERVLLFVSCYTSRDVYVVDPRAGLVLAVIRGANGPFSVNYDAARERLYIVDFRAATVRVVLITPMLECLKNGTMDGVSCEPRVLGAIGKPTVTGAAL